MRKPRNRTLPDEVELAYETLLEGETFERWSADWMDLVRSAFVTGYRLGLRAPAPRPLETKKQE